MKTLMWLPGCLSFFPGEYFNYEKAPATVVLLRLAAEEQLDDAKVRFVLLSTSALQRDHQTKQHQQTGGRHHYSDLCSGRDLRNRPSMSERKLLCFVDILHKRCVVEVQIDIGKWLAWHSSRLQNTAATNGRVRTTANRCHGPICT